MAAPILWTPGKNAFFLQENLYVHKIPRFRGGVFWFFWGGGECRFYFYGRADFSEHSATIKRLSCCNIIFQHAYCSRRSLEIALNIFLEFKKVFQDLLNLE